MEHFERAVDAVARMLPRHVDPEGKHAVARAVLAAAYPDLQEVVTAHARDAQALVDALNELHWPTSPDHDGLVACGHCMYAWPCPTLRLAGG